ncbi:MAG: alpha/beta hydrolase [Candidatus Binataceae bacterium]
MSPESPRGGWVRIAGPIAALILGVFSAAFYLHPVTVLRWLQLVRLGWSGVTQNEIALDDGLMTYLITGGYSDQEPVILIHGMGPNAALEWREIMKTLGEAHYKVIAPNLFGFDGSEHKQVRYTIAYQARAIEQLIEALKLDHVNLVGHGLGADVAFYVAVTHPERIERLIIVSGGLIGTSGARRLRQSLIPANAEAMRDQVEASFFGMPPMPAFMYERMMADVADDIAAQSDMLDSIPADEAHIRSGLGQIFNILTAIIWGGKDQIIPADHAQALRSMLPGSATAIFKDTGHFPQLEHPDEFDDTILFFLKQREGGR